MEWSDFYNSFNSYKVLTHYDRLKSIADGKFPVPSVVDIDPTNYCNLDCSYCDSQYFRKNNSKAMSEEHLLNIVNFISEWGVKAVCVGGGGEPLSNPATPKLLEALYENNIEIGLINNGTFLSKDIAEILSRTARWVGVSFEASNAKTYEIMKGANEFEKVRRNLKYLNNIKGSLEVTLKYLIHPNNIDNIYSTAKMAKEDGYDAIHIRPVGLENVFDKDGRNMSEDFNMLKYADEINEQLDLARSLETKQFKVFTIKHKFGEDFGKIIKFNKCRATPLSGVFAADGNFYICFTNRGKKNFILCEHFPNPKEVLKSWGGDKHKDMIEDINPEKCMRCAFNTYNEVIEKVVLEDNMTRNFL